MTEPTAPPAEAPLHTRYLELEYADRTYAQATKTIPVSHNDAHIWVTVPFDDEPEDPDNQHAMPGGWTILTAPADRDVFYSGVADVRLQGGVKDCSTHLMSYWARALQPGEIDGVDNIVEKRPAVEVFVGANESHPSATGTTYSNTHLQLAFKGRLPAGLKLRLCLDYWNAPGGSPALKLVAAAVSCDWGLISQEQG
ncbi:MAG: hypothetical protein ABW046_20650 [Actinoplanes sp.]